MNVFILLTVVANFFILIQLSTCDETCKAKTECLQPKKPIKLPIEIGLIYELYTDESKNDVPGALNEIVCPVIEEFNGSLVFKRYPGATVESTDNGIKCNGDDNCSNNREGGCKGMVNSEYSTNCNMNLKIDLGALQDCFNKKNSDQLLKDNSALRCSAGIPEDKIPALMFNQEYDPCHTFKSADELKKFLCSTFGEALKGKGCN